MRNPKILLLISLVATCLDAREITFAEDMAGNEFLSPSNGTFGHRVDYPVGSSPFGIRAGDLDGDGDEDIATDNFGANSVSILMNLGDGTFGAPTSYAVGSNPHSLAVSDFNGDGNLDIAVANSQSASVSVLLNSGDGTFANAVMYQTGALPYSVAAADLNGDGTIDLVTANAQDNDLSVLYNSGDGSFGSATDYGVGNHPESVCPADIDGDSDFDLIACNYLSNNITLLLNDGGGSFTLLTSISVGSGPVFVVSGDIDSDTDTDLLVANSLSANISVLVNDGSGAFTGPSNYNTQSGPYAITLGTLDSTSGSDIIVANWGSSTVSFFRGDGVGGFVNVDTFTVASGPYSICSDDFNGDGLPDLATANHFSNSVSVMYNKDRQGRVINVPLDQPTIQAGINASVNCDTVLVEPGEYSELLDYSGKSISLIGRLGADSTLLSFTALCNSLITVNGAGDSTTTLDGFTILDVSHSLGLIHLRGTSISIRNCHFIGNNSMDPAAVGWGVIATEPTSTPPGLIVENCTFKYNRSKAAATIAGNHTRGRITKCSFINNYDSTGLGGAIAIGGVYGASTLQISCNIATTAPSSFRRRPGT